VWVFGETLADGVLAEIAQASCEGKPVRYFNIDNEAHRIGELDEESLGFEQEVQTSTGMSAEELLKQMRSGNASDLVSALQRPIRVTA
jgi:hypothetical protein